MNQKNVSIYLSFAFSIVIVCSAVLPVFSLRENGSIASHGTLSYSGLATVTPTPTPTPSPSPTPSPTPLPTPYVGTNFAPLNTWKGSSSWAPCYWDTSVTHNGNPSWRNVGTDPYKNREMNSRWVAVKPGDHIILQAWMKVAPSDIGTTKELCPQSGARIGVDFYGDEPYGRLQSLNYNPAGVLPVKPEPTQGIIDNFVPWGSDWQFRQIDCIVPYKCYQVYPEGVTPNGVILWFAAMTNEMYGNYRWQNEDAPAWLSETAFYINPK